MMNQHTATTNTLLRKPTKRSVLVVLLLGLAFMFMSVIMLGGKAAAQGTGGVGSGGTGGDSGSGDEAHWADRGYGWVRYTVAGPGPSDGFRNGSSWATVQSTCRNTRYVYTFIVYDNYQKGKAYSYEGWNNPANLLDSRFGVGASVDHGRATTITIATAQAAFNQIDNPPYNVTIPPGWGFANGTMGWFCWDYIPPEEPPILSVFNINCNTAQVRADTQDGHRYAARLLTDIDGNGTIDNTDLLIENIADNATATFNTSSFKDFESRVWYVRVRDNVNGLTDTNVLPRTVGACLQFICASPAVTTSPASIPTGGTFTATAGFRSVNSGTTTSASIGSRGRNYAYYIRLQILGFANPYNPAQQIGSGTLTAGGGVTTVSATSGTITAPATLGVYDMSSSIRNTPTGGNLVVCNDPGNDLSVTEQPFFRVSGGDVGAGLTTVPPGCPGWGVGSTYLRALYSWNNGVSALGNSGAGTNLAAISGRLIDGFASAQGRNTFPIASSDLTFGEFNFFGLMGGNYPGGIPCPPDYASTRNNLTTPTIPVSGTFAVPSTNSAYYANSNLVIPGAAPITIGLNSRPIVYVDGDVYINNNIILAGGATTVDAMPNFYLVVRGNIWIHESVSRLDGVYIAQPDGGGARGSIYTCSLRLFGGNFPPTAAMLSGVCRNRPLDVYGAFIAKEQKLYRTFGSLTGNVPAETFYTTPNTWLAAPCVIAGCDSTGSDDLQSITSLPPIL